MDPPLAHPAEEPEVAPAGERDAASGHREDPGQGRPLVRAGRGLRRRAERRRARQGPEGGPQARPDEPEGPGRPGGDRVDEAGEGVNGLPALFGTGLGLAAGAGLNAYAVLLVYGGLARLFPEEFPGAVARLLSGTPALAAAGVLFLLEFVADKVPVLDHFWDILGSVVRPVAGALLAVGTVGPATDSTLLTVVAGGSGGFVALVSHLVKSVARVTSTALTAGLANAALSLAEDVLAFLQALVSIFLPTIALLLVVALGVLFLCTVPRAARSLDIFRRRSARNVPPPPRPAG
ncbi:MAG: DUF4126 domain-containing protein [Acidobacteria bacterium]|nr:MAG: DUF4126 domain-containing protein [Acidobacteriota bacterium]MCE7957213.1 DUF4126 domain-containing protein [Acidobacteria bacterium ACB2]